MAQGGTRTRTDASEFSEGRSTRVLSADFWSDRLTDILELMNSIGMRSYEFVTAFPEWEVERKESIKALREVASTLQESKEILNMGKIIGSSIQILGDLYSIFGGNSNTGDGRSAERNGSQSFGRSAARVGAVIRMGCSVIEPILNVAKLERVQTALNKDSEEFESLGRYFTETSQLNAAIDEFGGYQVFVEILDGVREAFFQEEAQRQLWVQAGKLTNRIDQELNISSSWTSLMASLPSMKNLQKENPEAYDHAITIISKKHTRDLMKEIAYGYEFVKEILWHARETLLEVEFNVPGLKSLVQSVLIQKLSTSCSNIGSAVNIAINVFDVYNVSEQKSELAEKILIVLKNMEAELTTLRTAYDRLKETYPQMETW